MPMTEASMQKVFFREAIARALVEEMTRDERVILIGQDVGAFGGSYKETRGIFERFGPARVRDMPVAEAATIGIAVGAAAAGLRPVAFITYMDFLTLGLDALVNYGAKIRYKTAGQLCAPLVVKVTAGAKGQGVAHSQSFEPWLMNVPGLKVVAPSTAADAYGLLKAAIRDDGPVVLVDHKRLFPRPGEIPIEESLVPLGNAVVRLRGRHVTLVAFGYVVSVALETAAMLAAEDISCEVVDLRSLWPLDLATVCASVEVTGAAFFLEEGQTTCGVGAELAFQVRERVPRARVARMGARRAPISSNPVFESFCVPDASRLCEAVRAFVGKASPSDHGIGPR